LGFGVGLKPSYDVFNSFAANEFVVDEFNEIGLRVTTQGNINSGAKVSNGVGFDVGIAINAAARDKDARVR
jgi:hypothetical protein